MNEQAAEQERSLRARAAKRSRKPSLLFQGVDCGDGTTADYAEVACRSVQETIDVVLEYYNAAGLYDEGPIDASEVQRDLENNGRWTDGASNVITNLQYSWRSHGLASFGHKSCRGKLYMET